MSMEQDERQEVYVIPLNFADSGGILGFSVTWRTLIDAVILGAPLLLINVLLPLDILFHIVIGIVTLIPVAMVSLLGIDGEGVYQILLAVIRFKLKRRKLSYISFSASPTEKSVLPIAPLKAKPKKKQEKAQKGTVAHQKATPTKEAKKPAPRTPTPEPSIQQKSPTAPKKKVEKPAKQAKSTQPRQPKQRQEKPPVAKAPKKIEAPQTVPTPQKNMSTPKSGGLLRGAMVETLLRKFELGEDEDESTMPR